jgi:MFS transporter, FHS family, glucose/mannose:H+ symporter
MPWISFLANGLWVMVIGLIGPSIPSIISEFGIGYSRAGLIFTLLSAGSLLGTFIGGIVSDSGKRRIFLSFFSIMLTVGLILVGLAPGYTVLLVIIFFMSLLGGPIGAVGQGIMLGMFPAKRSSYLSLQTMFAAAGSFIGPLIIAFIFLKGGSWRGAFFIVSVIAFILFIWTVFEKLPKPDSHHGSSISLKTILADRSVMLIGGLIFLSVGIDIGFSFWLAEYYMTVVASGAVVSSIAVSIYLCGVILSRFTISRLSESLRIEMIIIVGLIIAGISLVLFLNLPFIWIKLLLCFFYGTGIGPIFPLLLSKGTGLYPAKSGAVTGILFAAMSLSGMVFPLLIGVIGTGVGIKSAFYSLFVIGILIAVGVLGFNKIRKVTS